MALGVEFIERSRRNVRAANSVHRRQAIAPQGANRFMKPAAGTHDSLVARASVTRRVKTSRFGLRAIASSAWFVTTVSIAAGIALWAFFSHLEASPLFPSPLDVMKAIVEMMRSGTLIADIAVSLRRILIGFVLGCLVGIPLGLAMGLFRIVRAIFEPIMQFLRFVPPVAWLIPAVMWFGIGETSKILIIFYMTVFLVLINTLAGVAHLRVNHLRAAQNYGVSRWQLFAWIVLPATMSYSVTGARIALGNSFAAVVGAELIAANAGLGYRIVESGKWMDMSNMFGAMLVLGLLGILADRLVRAASARFLDRYLPGGADGR